MANEPITGKGVGPAQDLIDTVDDPSVILVGLYTQAIDRIGRVLSEQHGITDLTDPRIDWGNITVTVSSWLTTEEGTP